MIVWMLFSAAVALVLAVAAHAAESLARLAGSRVRWIWSGALALTLYLPASAALRSTNPVALPAVASAIDRTEVGHTQGGPSWRIALSERIESLRLAFDAPVQRAATALQRAVAPVANVYAASLAWTISVGLLLLLVGVGRRFRRARRDWPVVAMQGVAVRVAPHIGPVVIGMVRPEIVVPRWLLARPADEQRLVVTHEDEHVRSRDPLLLAGAWVAVVLMPWSPAVWYMLSRLRLAVELDCDARVLRRGAAARSYGSLLIDVAQHASALRLSALALADDASHLQQRLLAMKPTLPRFAPLRAGLGAVCALIGLLVACQAELPTPAEIEGMDVAAATRAAREVGTFKVADIDDTVGEAKTKFSDVSARAPGAIDRVHSVPALPRKSAQTNVASWKMAAAMPAGDSGGLQRHQSIQDETAAGADTLPGSATLATRSKVTVTPLILIDGVRATLGEMRLLDPAQIESVEVLKGRLAALSHSDLEAAQGVIVITTKRGDGK